MKALGRVAYRMATGFLGLTIMGLGGMVVFAAISVAFNREMVEVWGTPIPRWVGYTILTGIVAMLCFLGGVDKR